MSFANPISATLIAAEPMSATFQTTRTVRSGRPVRTSFTPSATSRQCPRVIGSSDRSLASETRATSAAETRNVTAFTAYGTDGLQTASIAPATTGPIIHASVSAVASREFALTSSSSGTRFGIAAFAAGMKNPVATPATAASATIAVGLSTNGSAANTPKRARSEPIISHRRDSRSTSGPSRSPITTIGRNSVIRSAATQTLESVLS